MDGEQIVDVYLNETKLAVIVRDRFIHFKPLYED
jgi:hypothetical protein